MKPARSGQPRSKWSLDCPSGRLGFEEEGVKTAAIAPISLFRSLPKQHPPSLLRSTSLRLLQWRSLNPNPRSSFSAAGPSTTSRFATFLCLCCSPSTPLSLSRANELGFTCVTQINDISLADYIAVSVDKHANFVPHTAGRYSVKRFRKAQCPIVERCVRLVKSICLWFRVSVTVFSSVRVMWKQNM
jgi:hypothetical protein